MSTTFRPLAAAALLLFTAACAGPTPAEQTEKKERELLAPLKTAYPDVVMGFDMHGASVDVSIDMNGYVSTDEDKVDQLKAEALKRWRTAWTNTHPGAHGTITVRFVDFRGNQQYKASAKV